VQVVSGIRWFYRRFGYEYALAGQGKRHLPLDSVPALTEKATELYRIRRAEEVDIPTLRQLYERSCTGKLVIRTRPETLWRYHITGQDKGSLSEAYYAILDATGALAGYFGTWADFPWGIYHIREFSVREGVPIHIVLPTVLRFISNFFADNAA